MVDTEMTSYPAQIHAIQVQLQRLFPYLVRVAVLFWFGRVSATAMHTLVPL
jgi:hypothetical protein